MCVDSDVYGSGMILKPGALNLLCSFRDQLSRLFMAVPILGRVWMLKLRFLFNSCTHFQRVIIYLDLGRFPCASTFTSVSRKINYLMKFYSKLALLDGV